MAARSEATVARWDFLGPQRLVDRGFQMVSGFFMTSLGLNSGVRFQLLSTILPGRRIVVRKIGDFLRKAVQKGVDMVVNWVKDKFKGLFKRRGAGTPSSTENEPGSHAVDEGLVMPTSLLFDHSTNVQSTQESLKKEIVHSQDDAVIYRSPKADPKEVLKGIVARYGRQRLDNRRKILHVHSIGPGKLDRVSTLAELGRAAADDTGLSQIVLHKFEGGWSLSGRINPIVSGLARYHGAPADPRPLELDAL